MSVDTDYYDALIALPEAHAWASLRTPAVAGEWTINGGGSAAGALTASPPNAYWAAGADGAQVTWDQALPNISQQLFLPVQQDSGTYLLIVDYYYPSLWRAVALGGVIAAANYVRKELQARYDAVTSEAQGQIFFEQYCQMVQGGNPAVNDPAYVGNYQTRIYSQIPAPSDAGMIPVVKRGAGTSGSWEVGIRHSTWIRFIQEHRLNQPHTAFTSWEATYGVSLPAGTYHMISAWMLQAGDDPTNLEVCRRIFQMPVYRQKGNPPAGTLYDTLTAWNLETNTSNNNDRATGTVRISGTNGTVIPDNTEVLRVSDSRAYQVTDGPKTISGGIVDVAVRDVTGTFGPDGNTAQGVAMSCAVAGVSSAVTQTALTGGAYMLTSTDAHMFARNMVVLQNYALHATAPEVNNPEIFTAPGEEPPDPPPPGGVHATGARYRRQYTTRGMARA